MANRWGIPKEIEVSVRMRDVCCVYCGVSFTNSSTSRKTKPTWEHIVNDIKLSGLDNIALCCGSCNASKGSKLLIDWLSSKCCLTKGISRDTVASVVRNHLDRK